VPFVSSFEVLIPVHNALAELRECWASLERNRDDRLVRVTFVDDASAADTQTFLEGLAWNNPRVRVLRSRSNKGYTKSVNRGLKDLIADAVVILNSDTLVTPGALDRLLAGLNSGDDVAATGPLSNAASWQSIPRLKGEDGQFVINPLPVGHSADDVAALLALEFPSANRPSVPVLNGFCTVFRSEAVREIGKLDAKHFPKGYGEENDYCARLIDAGYRLLICEDAYVYHVKSASFGHEVRMKLSRAGGEGFVKKHGQARLDQMIADMKTHVELDEIRARIAASLEKRFGK
jgi:glycosyltransferase involved in cell wall biosynthesis